MGERDTIIVADDVAGIRDALTKILTKEGYSVLTACDGEEAVQLLQRRGAALILADLKMPKIDGTELLKIAKAI